MLTIRKGSSLDVILTNRPRSFQKTSVIETGISDHHILGTTLFRSLEMVSQIPQSTTLFVTSNIFLTLFKNLARMPPK